MLGVAVVVMRLHHGDNFPVSESLVMGWRPGLRLDCVGGSAGEGRGLGWMRGRAPVMGRMWACDGYGFGFGL